MAQRLVRRVKSVSVRGYRAFKTLDLDLPPPAFPHETDVIVLGSVNGVGKTTLLESVMWGGLAAVYGSGLTNIFQRLNRKLRRYKPGFPLLKDLKRQDSVATQIKVSFSDNSICTVDLGTDGLTADNGRPDVPEKIDSQSHQAELALRTILRPAINPAVIPGFIYLTSYRRIYEGSLSLDSLHGERSAALRFKVEVLKAILVLKQGADLKGEDGQIIDPPHPDSLSLLDDLLDTFAGVRLAQLSVLSGGQIQLQVEGKTGRFPLDNLSSGQKEIVSTLFLLWSLTKDRPGVVLLDEPELYLNPEWHRHVMRKLFTLAPDNQYLIATHSEEIARQVAPDRLRILRGT